MVATQLNCSGTVVSGGLLNRRSTKLQFSSRDLIGFRGFVRKCSVSIDRGTWMCNGPVVRQRKGVIFTLSSQLNSDGDFESSASTQEHEVNRTISESYEEKMTEVPRSVSQSTNVKHELIKVSLPAVAGLAIEPLSQLMETAFIGRLGSAELACASISLSIFNTISKLFNLPLLSVSTSFVAEDISKNAGTYYTSEKVQLSSVSTALLLAAAIGIFEAMAISLGSGPLLRLMGISKASPMHAPARAYLLIRALGAPANVVSLALQGIFRGFKDTKTPAFCLGFGNVTAIFLFPFFMHFCRLGYYGAAISTVVSQFIVTILMIWNLNKRVVLLPPKLGELQFGAYIKSGGFLIVRTLAVLLTMSLATSMAARQGPTAMAAYQICSQLWLSFSLLTDALGASAQALIPGYLSKHEYETVKDITRFVIQMGIVTGVFLAVALGLSFRSLAPLFTKDAEVLNVIRSCILFVSLSQPLNALAFICDRLHYGVSDFPYSARSMMVVSAISSVFLLYAPPVFGLPGVCAGVALFMGLRTVAGFIRFSDRKGPWWFLHRTYISLSSTRDSEGHCNDLPDRL